MTQAFDEMKARLTAWRDEVQNQMDDMQKRLQSKVEQANAEQKKQQRLDRPVTGRTCVSLATA